MNKFIITIAYPCLILNRMANLEMTNGTFSNFLIVIVLSLIIFFVLGGYAYLYGKIRKFNKEDAPVAEFAILAPNNGFIGFPIAFTFFGDLGLLYMIACNLSLNIVFFTYGIKLMKRGRETHKKSIIGRLAEFTALLINPKISAAILGLFLCRFGIELPETVNMYLSMLGSVATPMAMVFIGGTLTACSIKETLGNKFVLDVSFNKLFAAPIITLAIVWFLPVDPLVKVILAVCNAIPVATTVPIFSEIYDRNKALAGEILFVTTILSMASIPVSVWIFTRLLM